MSVQVVLRVRESFGLELGLRAVRWAATWLGAAVSIAQRALLGWRGRFSRWRAAGMAPRSPEAGDVELQTVQLTGADSAAADAAPSESNFEA